MISTDKPLYRPSIIGITELLFPEDPGYACFVKTRYFSGFDKCRLQDLTKGHPAGAVCLHYGFCGKSVCISMCPQETSFVRITTYDGSSWETYTVPVLKIKERLKDVLAVLSCIHPDKQLD